MEKKVNDITPKEQTPSFDELVLLIEKNFKDYLEQSKAFTAEEIEQGWQRYKTLNHLYQGSPQQHGPVWVKASDRLPGLTTPVKWREGEREMKVKPVWYMVLDSNSESLSKCEWYDESGTAAAPDCAKLYDTLYYTVLPVLHKLRHRTDNNTRMVDRGSEIRNMIINTIAEIKKLPDPISANEPPFLVQSTAAAGREDAVEFAEWLNRNFIAIENKDGEAAYVEYGPQEYHRKQQFKIRQLYQLFKEQKEATNE